MSTDMRIVLPNRPGALLTACEAIANVGINIQGMCVDLRPGESWAYLHILTENAQAARQAIENEGFEVLAEHDVDLLKLDDNPGSLADCLRGYREEGRNIEVVYVAGDSRVVIGTEDMRKPIQGVKVSDARY